MMMMMMMMIMIIMPLSLEGDFQASPVKVSKIKKE